MRRHLTTSLSFFFLIGAVASASAQPGPKGWRWHTDHPATLVTESGATDSTLYFVTMPPGWHVTTGPATLLFNPAHTASDRFSLEAGIYLFPDAGEAEYGLFTGGEHGLAFVLRADGSSAVHRLDEASGEWLVPWAGRPGPLQQADQPVFNVLRVDASPHSLTFVVNDSTLATIPRTDGLAEGRFGFRVGSGMNLHIKSLDYTQHLAVPRN